MDVVILVGRILFVILFLGSALGHLTKTSDLAAYARSKGVPSPRAATQASGVLMLVGALLLVLGIWADLGALLLFLFLLPTAFQMHPFWTERSAGTREQERVHFLKDLALAGAALMLFALFASEGEGIGLMLTGPLF
ncbi:DoxX family membrane protein [Streptomyces sp. JJ66]|uniref:DoxX family membrane protein n=1 Tax=Streptomyces sp. JJ66 TaxID=2803843 RepID=UPI001C55A80B|nr:DoxX family membrane protein [Streptomyces sp. JJ66]MBW1603826.1 DoxX family membrane protein [Streptomyces sp. JJ66]